VKVHMPGFQRDVRQTVIQVQENIAFKLLPAGNALWHDLAKEIQKSWEKLADIFLSFWFENTRVTFEQQVVSGVTSTWQENHMCCLEPLWAF
jgi:hypothetical protein